MRSKRPFVIVTRKLPDPIETRMMELFTCRLNLDDKPLSKAELIEAVGRTEVLVPTVTDRIDAEVLAAAGPELKLIASFGTGVDHVDLAAAQQLRSARRRLAPVPGPADAEVEHRDLAVYDLLSGSREAMSRNTPPCGEPRPALTSALIDRATSSRGSSSGGRRLLAWSVYHRSASSSVSAYIGRNTSGT